MTSPASPPRLRTVTATVIGILAAVAAALALALPATAAGTNHATQGNAGTSGNPKSPQPVSNADQNSGGANGQCPSGPYCSTRDGSASGNGNGGGKAVGKPCAGCVGKADNKNPRGQMPNGSDHNAGYECDRNHGIGRTNPAHTGCTTSAPTTTTPPPTETPTVMPTETPTETPTGTPTETPTMTPTETGSGQSAPAQSTPAPTTTACVPTAANGFCATVLGEKQTKTPPSTIVPPAVSGEQVVRTPSSGLPFTGAAIATLVLVAALALVGGSLLAMVARRRRRT